MNICEAIKKAMETGKCIATAYMIGEAKIKPTDTIHNCIVMRADGSHPSRYGWQPSAEDLTREDWELVD